ncbi:MAG: hypothetical protein HOW73_19770 [Polyangiaceae bacterium]|nr:hypothetical protein [Polyangiaceae bacterium]
MDPWTPEEERLAVEALASFQNTIIDGCLDELREFLVDELLCTSCGRERLQRPIRERSRREKEP